MVGDRMEMATASPPVAPPTAAPMRYERAVTLAVAPMSRALTPSKLTPPPTRVSTRILSIERLRAALTPTPPAAMEAPKVVASNVVSVLTLTAPVTFLTEETPMMPA